MNLISRRPTDTFSSSTHFQVSLETTSECAFPKQRRESIDAWHSLACLRRHLEKGRSEIFQTRPTDTSISGFHVLLWLPRLLPSSHYRFRQLSVPDGAGSFTVKFCP